jgi:hypothetical protein
MTWYRKILRKIHGKTYENGYWKIQANQELYNQFKSPGFGSVNKAGILERLDHVVRMDGERTVKKLLERKLQKS